IGQPKSFPFFCPMDADLNDINYTSGRSRTMLNLDEDLFAVLGRSNPGTRLVLVDACRNELEATGTKKSLADAVVRVPDGVQALFSCGKTQKAYESSKLRHGVFFYYVLEGLEGKARNTDNEVTWEDLSRYVRQQVTRNVGKIIGGGAMQTPAVVGYIE